MNNTTTVGAETINLIDSGLEVNAEIAAEEPQCPQGVDEDVLKLVRKHGLKEVLASLSFAAWSAAECHEDMEDEDLVTVLRLRVFGRRIDKAIGALK